MVSREIIDRVAKKCKVDPEVVIEIESEFWKAFRYFISHPLEVGKGLLINKLFVLKIPPYNVQRYIDASKGKVPDEHLEFHYKLLNNLKNGKEKGKSNKTDT